MTDVLILVYCQVHILELMCQGMGRDKAAYNAWQLYYGRLLALCPASAAALYRGMEVLTGRNFRYGCLSATSRNLISELRQTPPPDLDPAEIARLLWLLEVTRRVSEGQKLLQAARAAHDRHLNKPRQQRRPVQRDWLATEADAALDWLWGSVLSDRVHDDGPRPKGSEGR